ncbi:MAG: cation:dicarboxylate symporter family transporter, partial [Flavobacteriales bacterium]
VSGSGFITLAATLTIVPSFPIYGMALLLGIDKFMSECRAMTNFMGNAVATLVVSHWDDQLDREAYNRTINGSLEC